MIQQLPTHILEEHLIPYITDYTIPHFRESCDLFNELSYKRFSKIQSKKIQEIRFVHKTVITSLYNRINSITADYLMIKQDYNSLSLTMIQISQQSSINNTDNYISNTI
jgi:hypothetical protein